MTNQTTAFDEPSRDAYDEPTGSVDLTAFDEDYDQAEAPDFEDVPDGKYQIRVMKAQLGASSKGDPMLKWDLVVLSGPHAGRHIFKNAVITRDSIPFVKGDLKTLGLALPRFSELPQHLGEQDEDTQQWAAFFTTWRYLLGDRPVTADDLCQRILAHDTLTDDALPDALLVNRDRGEGSLKRSLGRNLSRLTGRIFGGHKLCHAGHDTRHNVRAWRLIPVQEGRNGHS